MRSRPHTPVTRRPGVRGRARVPHNWRPRSSRPWDVEGRDCRTGGGPVGLEPTTHGSGHAPRRRSRMEGCRPMRDEWVYVVTDIEVDGPWPGPNSMRSFASVAVTLDGTEHGRFEAVLEELPGAAPDAK